MANGAARACARAVCAAGALATFLGTADAQTRTATQAERERRSEAARAERLRAEANAARQEVRALNARLAEAGRRRSETEALAAAAEERLAALEAEISAEDARRAHARDALEAALITAAFSRRRAEPQAARTSVFARAAVAEFASAERGSTRTIAAGRSQLAEIDAERATLAEAQAALDAERAAAAAALTERRAAQVRLASDATAAERRARTLAAEARNLRELAARTQRRRTQTANNNARPSVIPSSWVAPTEGSIARAFGAASAGGPAAQGVVLRTRSGAQVAAPASGEVAYAGPFRSYGNVLIMNLNDGYAVVFTGLEAIHARVGETVRAGQPVGVMPTSDTSAPELYVEVRREGRPVDPGRWLDARGIAASGAAQAG